MASAAETRAAPAKRAADEANKASLRAAEASEGARRAAELARGIGAEVAAGPKEGLIPIMRPAPGRAARVKMLPPGAQQVN